MDYEIVRLIDRPAIKEQAAQWFHENYDSSQSIKYRDLMPS